MAEDYRVPGREAVRRSRALNARAILFYQESVLGQSL